MELREEATQEDAEQVKMPIMISKVLMVSSLSQVVEIMRSSMIDTFSDDIGQLDFSRSGMGSDSSAEQMMMINFPTRSGMSSRGAAKKFMRAAQLQAQRLQKQRFDWVLDWVIGALH